MQVNTAKTEIVVFSNSKATSSEHHDGWSLSNVPLKVCDQFKYLGFHLHATESFKFAAKAMHAAGLKALFALIQRCSALKISNPHIKLKLFDALVKPVLTYGAQLWGVAFPGPQNVLDSVSNLRHLDSDMERLQMMFLRRISGVKKSTHRLVLLNEMESQPLQMDFWRLVLNFWNRCISLPSDSLLRLAFLENVGLARSGAKCWSGTVIQSLDGVGVRSVHDGLPLQLCVDEIMKSWKANVLIQPLLGLAKCNPRQHDSRDVKLCTYSAWFAHPAKPSPHLRKNIAAPLHHVLMRFRMSSHSLHVESGRSVSHGERLPRAERACPLCVHKYAEEEVCKCMEDELHFCFQCPAYDQLRLKYRRIFSKFLVPGLDATDLHGFFNQPDQRSVARFLHDALTLRSEFMLLPAQAKAKSVIVGVDWQLDNFSDDDIDDVANDEDEIDSGDDADDDICTDDD
jgi:hypothetical protein